MTAILIFKCTKGAGVGDYSSREKEAREIASFQTVPRPLRRFDAHVRWPPVTQSLRSRQSYGKIRDCEQSNLIYGEMFVFSR